MGHADDCHFGGHHGVGRMADFFERLEQHLPHAGENAQAEAFGVALTAGALIGANRWIIGRVWCDLHDADPMGELGEIA